MNHKANDLGAPSPIANHVWYRRWLAKIRQPWRRFQSGEGKRWPEQVDLSAKAMFAKALPLLCLWLTLPALMCLLTFGIRVAEPLLVWDSELPSKRETLVFTDTQGISVTLHASYPHYIVPDPDIRIPSLSLWLSPYNTVPPRSSTTRAVFADVSLEGHSLTLTDEHGQPIIQPVPLVPSSVITGPTARFYLQPRRTDFFTSKTVQAQIALYDGSGQAMNPDSVPLTFTLAPGLLAMVLRISRMGSSAAILAALATAAVGFAVQQWSKMAEEERLRQKAREEAYNQINELPKLLERDLSEGARHYDQLLQASGSVWSDQAIQHHLRATWEQVAQSELRIFVELARVLRESFEDPDRRLLAAAAKFEDRKTVAALEWAYARLDEDWQMQAREMLLILSAKLPHASFMTDAVVWEMLNKSLYAVMQVWPHLSFWRAAPASSESLVVEPLVQRGIQYLGLKTNPFGSLQAETDSRLLKYHMDPLWLQDLRTVNPTLIFGQPGAGKTAAALLVTHDCLNAHIRSPKADDLFPVYCRIEPETMSLYAHLSDLAQALAKVLLRYLAVTPKEFVNARVSSRAAIAHLFGRYIGTWTDITLALHEAGLPEAGLGLQMLERIKQLSHGISFTKELTGADLLSKMSQAYPQGFKHVLFLLDVQQVGDSSAFPTVQYVRSLVNLMAHLTRAGIVVKIFLPVDAKESPPPLDRYTPVQSMYLKWESADLLQLLRNWLAPTGDDSIMQWCNPEAKDLLSKALPVNEVRRTPEGLTEIVNQLLVNAAHGTPRGLTEKGNALLRRIGEIQRLLSVEDLQEILGT